MDLHKYKTYQEYVNKQIKGNKNNPDGQWCEEDEIEFLSKYLLSHYDDIQFGICHGCKQGNEQAWFRKHTGAEVIGTDITDVAEKYPHTICWDFNKVKSEWEDNTDFIYSNAFDHTYDPEKCLNAWMSCIRKNGCCIIEWSPADTRSNDIDPFGATLEEYESLIDVCGFVVKDQLEFPTELRGVKTFLVIGHEE